MEYVIKTTFRGVPRTAALEKTIQDHAARLVRYCPGLTSCQAVVDLDHAKQHSGKGFTVRIELKVPRELLVYNSRESDGHGDEDLYAVINRSFKAARRLLQEYTEKRREKRRQSSAQDDSETTAF